MKSGAKKTQAIFRPLSVENNKKRNKNVIKPCVFLVKGFRWSSRVCRGAQEHLKKWTIWKLDGPLGATRIQEFNCKLMLHVSESTFYCCFFLFCLWHNTENLHITATCPVPDKIKFRFYFFTWVFTNNVSDIECQATNKLLFYRIISFILCFFLVSSNFWFGIIKNLFKISS